ncbi:1-acyl-sn-glycerol-3-phosphate acyltransferase [Arthrobacter sp. NamB2]|uniref:lysophospholipid acyltransferase family protein n=1 Tax=Arthrobacter sp. NamB2 TaxID=2576035 RepID=UPI0010C9B32F|nr:lysophospholipid acyltransferase family protein [Arthrobacter sp. NamB2]TKV29875.1 1-acyl-sn-glycerol-3-phosphate acyltransferase [Arthrobacter sp. NamB2]
MGEPRGSRAMFTFLASWVRPVMNALMGKEWHGQERLPRGAGVIVCPNHVTEIDPVVVGHFLYNQGIMPHFLAKASLFKVPVIGWILRTIRQIPVERVSAGANRSLEAARDVLADGGGIIIYPEGTLTRDPDMWPMKGRTGAARLALQTGAPVVPIAQWGAHEVFPRYAKRFYLVPRKRARVLVGDPVDLSEFQGAPLTRTTLEAATDRIIDAITELLAELRGETPPGERWDPAQKQQERMGRGPETPNGDATGPAVPHGSAPEDGAAPEDGSARRNGARDVPGAPAAGGTA